MHPDLLRHEAASRREGAGGLQSRYGVRESPPVIVTESPPPQPVAPVSTMPEGYEEAVGRSVPRPTTWADVIGNDQAKEVVHEAISTADKTKKAMPHTLLFGPPGVGKTTISRMISTTLGGEFFETTASTLETSLDVIRILTELNAAYERTKKAPILFIDEIHMLGLAKGRLAIDPESIYPLLEDWQFPHNLVGQKFTTLTGEVRRLTTTMMRVWPFSCVGATTEPGMLNPAIQRRFLLHIQMQAYTEEHIALILQGSARRLSWPLTDDAAAELARYARCNPGRSYQLLTKARNRAIATDQPSIDLPVVQQIIRREGLYPLGLDDNDVRILRLLANRMPRGAGAAEIARAIGISPSQFASMQEPYLRQLGMVETLSRRVITPGGLRWLATNGLIGSSSPEVRAAMMDRS